MTAKYDETEATHVLNDLIEGQQPSHKRVEAFNVLVDQLSAVARSLGYRMHEIDPETPDRGCLVLRLGAKRVTVLVVDSGTTGIAVFPMDQWCKPNVPLVFNRSTGVLELLSTDKDGQPIRINGLAAVARKVKEVFDGMQTEAPGPR